MGECVARHYRTGALCRLRWADGRLHAVEPLGAGPEGGAALRLAPALFDLQVNGYGGLDFSRPEHVPAVAAALARHGVARFLPTVTTASPEAMAGALRAIAAARGPETAAAVPGIHLEGPYISPLDGPRGAHPAAHVRAPAWDHFAELQRAAGGAIRVVTLAPELPGALAFIARAAAAGILVAIGHTAADGDTIRAAAAAGARLCTHLGNGLAATLDRHRNPLWPQLACRDLSASFIADGHHLPADALSAMMRAKGTDRCLLVSDAVPQAGLPPGRHMGIGGADVDVEADGSIRLHGTPYLAGSGAHLLGCAAWAAACGAAGAADALDMASVGPARLLGMGGGAGDVLVYREEPGGGWTALLTVRAGAVLHDALGGGPG